MRQYSYTINGAAYDVRIDSIKNGVAKVNVNGLDFDVQIHGNLSEEDLTTPSAQEAPLNPPSGEANSATHTHAEALPRSQSGLLPQMGKDGGARKGLGSGEGAPIPAPLPGVITKVLVSVGQKVKKGDTVLVLEAMKMENNIQAEHDGTVTAVCCRPGDSVMEGATLVTIG